jgi:hypothetical protein
LFSPYDTPSLTVSPDKLSFIIAEAREFDAKDIVTDPGNGARDADAPATAKTQLLGF